MTVADINQETFDALLNYCKDEASAWADKPNVHDYDFSCPHRFMPAHHRRLCDFSDQVARNASVAMGLSLRTHYKMTAVNVGEEYSVRHNADEHRYYMPVRVHNDLVGYYVVPAKTAIVWVTTMLGGICKGEVDDSRPLSALENDLLTDLTHKLTESFSSASGELGGPEFQLVREVTVVPPDFEDGAEQILQYTRFEFERAEADFTLPFSLILLSPVVEPIAGLLPPPTLTPRQARERLLDSIDQVGVPLKIRVDHAEVAVRDIATIEVGDVLMLNKRVSEPIDVMFCETVLMTGVPVQSQGRFGVSVDSFREDMPAPLPPLDT